MTNEQLLTLVTLADDIRVAQRAYLANRSEANGKAVGVACANYDRMRTAFANDLPPAMPLLHSLQAENLPQVHAKLEEWAREQCDTEHVIDLVLRLAQQEY